MKTIQINLDQKIIVDDDDYERVGKHSWSTWVSNRRGIKEYHCPKSSIKGKDIILSRFLLGTKKGIQVDHINRDVLDNRRKNLREVTNSVNGLNRGLFKRNKLGVQGVNFDKRHKKFRAEIQIASKKMMLGYFDDIKTAEQAYLDKKKEFFDSL